MRRIPVAFVKPGMINARALYNSEGKILLAAGTALTDFCLERLIRLGIPSLYIRDEFTGDLTIPDVVSEKTRVETIKTVRHIFDQIQSAGSVNLLSLKTGVDIILDELLANTNSLAQTVDIRTSKDYLYAHSVNVCILSLMTGISLNYNTLQLKELGIGALLHDIGYIFIPSQLLSKPQKLTKAEYRKVKGHSRRGFEILKQYPDIPPLSAQVAYQHHERIDGSGYPQRLKGSDIHEYARIVAIADVYDALLADRVYRPSFQPCAAMREIIRGVYTLYDPRIAAAFMENITMYPVGSLVKLNNGEVGIVVDVNKQSQHRPIIRLLLNEQGKKVAPGNEIDLEKTADLSIIEGCSEGLSVCSS
jgi:HD-GYP domain-containing protein (c-di-GMP phosphodiesterase class II)